VTSRPLRVVLADDAQLFRMALAELLDGNGCQTVAQVALIAYLLNNASIFGTTSRSPINWAL